MAFSEQWTRQFEGDAPTTVMRTVTDTPTKLIPLPRGAGAAEAATVLMQALDRGELYQSTPAGLARRARRARKVSRRKMRGAARQYGRAYYVPKGTRRWWIALFFGLSFVFGALQFFAYVAVCRWLGLLP